MATRYWFPTTWHIIVTEENVDIVSKWRYGNDSKLSIGQLAGMAKTTYENEPKFEKGHNPGHEPRGTSYDFGGEITIEEFKKYVLNEEDSYDESKPEDMTCLIDILKKLD